MTFPSSPSQSLTAPHSRFGVDLDCGLCGGLGRIRTYGGYVRCYLCNTVSAGPAHGERPVVNRRAGAARASGSTPPSGINLQRRSSPQLASLEPARTPSPVRAGRGGAA